jgi:hypothetical protein
MEPAAEAIGSFQEARSFAFKRFLGSFCYAAFPSHVCDWSLLGATGFTSTDRMGRVVASAESEANRVKH